MMLANYVPVYNQTLISSTLLVRGERGKEYLSIGVDNLASTVQCTNCNRGPSYQECQGWVLPGIGEFQ
ncbi:hypothetical protein FRX31_015120, partial [Thalictrum thalictroides]